MPTNAHVHSKRADDLVDSALSPTCPRRTPDVVGSRTSARCLRSYFKATLPKTDSVPPVEEFFFFDRGDMRSVANAHETARATVAELGRTATLSVWAPPVMSGPWASVPAICVVPGAAS